MLPAELDVARLRAAFFDLDGTVLDEGRPLPGIADALAALRASGVRPLIATGRMFTSARRLGAALGVDGPAVCYQGAVVRDLDSGETLAHQPIPADLARELIAAVEERGHAVNAFADEAVYISRDNEQARRYVHQNEVPLHVVPDLAAWVSGPITKLIVTAPPEALDLLRAELEPQFADRAFIAKSLPHYLEMAARGVSKASGAAVVAERLGLDAGSCIAFGDGENDLELLDWAGFGVAVGGGFPALLERADWVCPPLERLGVPAAVSAIAEARRWSARSAAAR